MYFYQKVWIVLQPEEPCFALTLINFSDESFRTCYPHSNSWFFFFHWQLARSASARLVGNVNSFLWKLISSYVFSFCVAALSNVPATFNGAFLYRIFGRNWEKSWLLQIILFASWSYVKRRSSNKNILILLTNLCWIILPFWKVCIYCRGLQRCWYRCSWSCSSDFPFHFFKLWLILVLSMSPEEQFSSCVVCWKSLSKVNTALMFK